MIAAGNGQRVGGQSKLRSLNSTFRAGVPQLYANIDRVKAKSLDVPLETIFGTLQSSMGSTYVNDFNLFGRTFQVRLQADQKFRLKPDDIRRLEVRNRSGAMLPLGTLATITEKPGPQIITRYNLYPSSSISGEAAAGFSSGQALKLMEQMAARLFPSDVGYEWTGMSYQEKKGRVAGDLCLRAGRPAGLPGPRRSVRELADPGRRDPGRSPGAPGDGRRRGDPGVRREYLHPDRHRPDHRPGEQERDPDRRVRPRTSRARARGSSRRR